MKKTFLTIMSVALFAACGTKEPKLTSGIDMNNLDTTANPADDFYQYACGGWMKNNPLDDEHSRYGSFDKLDEVNQQQLRDLVEETAAAKNPEGSVASKIAMLYNIAMDSTTLQKQDAEPLQPMLQEIANLKDRDAIISSIPSLHMKGIFAFFGIYNNADADNADMQIASITHTGLGMGDRDYYLVDNAKNQELRTAYLTMTQQFMQLSGYDKLAGMPADKLAHLVFDLETRLAKANYDKVLLRNPQVSNNKTAIADAVKMVPAIHLDNYFNGLGLKDIDTFNIDQPKYFEELSKVLSTEKEEILKAYIAACVIRNAAPYLSDNFVDAHFAFYGTAKSGKQQNRPRWKRSVNTVDGCLGEALGQLYVAKYFPAEAKKRMVTLVENLKTAFGQRIEAAQWMDPETKKLAIEKLQCINTKIGYPDNWRDYSKLEIKNDSYWQNIVRSNIFDMEYMLNKINKPTDREEWLMTPQTVNAYYNPTTNEICFPAGILQPPFFDMNADDAVNYGAIGMVIGHEMTHGFDDQGHEFDKSGNLYNWWKSSDSANFKTNAQVLVDYFNGIKVLDDPETYANGEYTLGENIADNGGVHISYQAMQNAIAQGQVNGEAMDGFTASQRFFLAYARVWASNIRNEEILNRTNSDVHSLGRWRVNGTLPHIDEFYEAWNITETNKMYLAPEMRVKLW